MRGLTTIAIVIGLVLIASVAVTPVVLAQDDNQTDTNQTQTQPQPAPYQAQSPAASWRLWIFLYNLPLYAKDITMKVVDDSTEHKVITTSTLSPVTDVTDPGIPNQTASQYQGPTVTWAYVTIYNSEIGDNTGYYVALSGEDIPSQAFTFTHHIGNTNTYAAFDWTQLTQSGASSSNGSSSVLHTTNVSY